MDRKHVGLQVIVNTTLISRRAMRVRRWVAAGLQLHSTEAASCVEPPAIRRRAASALWKSLSDRRRVRQGQLSKTGRSCIPSPAAGNVVVGGSFLADDGGRAFNTFLLASPDGTSYRHDKDFPTYWETCYYKKGSDDGVLSTPVGPVGVALCWEMVRSGTARRLLGKVRLLLAGSTWWTLPEEAGPDHPLRAANLAMLKASPPRLARMLGIPVVHASHAGPFEGFSSPELPDVPYRSVYLEETLITAAHGRLLGRMRMQDGAGVITANIDLPGRATPSEAIPERFWLPEQMPQEWKDAWDRWFARGEDYYKTVTQPYLATGELEEDVPPDLR